MTESQKKQERLKKQFCRARISLNDFEQAIEFLAALESAATDVPRRSLLTSAVIAYSRPFSNNEPSENAHATSRMHGNPRSLFTPEHMLLHEDVLNLRNKAIAHAQWSEYPGALRRSRPNGFVLQARFFDILAKQLETHHFRDIAQLMRDHCRKEIFELNRQLTRQ